MAQIPTTTLQSILTALDTHPPRTPAALGASHVAMLVRHMAEDDFEAHDLRAALEAMVEGARGALEQL